MNKLLNIFNKSILSWHLALFAIFLVLLIDILVVAIINIPPSSDALGQFASDFRAWCFSSDIDTGEIETVYLVTFLMESFLIVGICWFLGGDKIRENLRISLVKGTPHLMMALIAVLGASMAFAGLVKPAPEQSFEFPAESLRTAVPMPQFKFRNHLGKMIDTQDFKGNVTVVFGFYTDCNATCPLIINQIKNVVKNLSEEEKKNLRIIGVTLDPTVDDQEKLADAIKAYQLPDQLYQFVTGEQSKIDKILDNLSFARKRNAVTGEIDHANQFVLIDKTQHIAYRFSLGKLQENWLQEAIRLLTLEKLVI